MNDTVVLSRTPVPLSVVVPLYNEEDSLEELHEEICRSVDRVGCEFEVVYVDDGSIDRSFEVLSRIHQRDPRAKVVRFRKNSGKADALSAGFALCSGDRIVTLDADLQDDPAEIPNLLSALDRGYDLVSGWKKRRRDPITKRWPSRVFNQITSLVTGIRLHDFNCGLKAYCREVVETVRIAGELHRYIPVLAAREGFRVGEIVVNHRPRKYGKTKYGPSRFFKGFFDLVTVLFLGRYTKRPLHLFGLVGGMIFLAGLAITLYLVVLRMTHRAFLSNRPLLFIGVLLLIVGVQFFSLGLLGEMVSRSHDSHHGFRIRQTLGV